MALRVEFFRKGRFVDDRFARQARFVHLQGYGLEQLSVRGNLFSLFKDYNVVHDDVFLGDFVDASVAEHFYERVVVDLVQHVEFFVGVPYEPRGDSRGQQNGHRDADCFRYFNDAFRKIHGHGDAAGQQHGHEQNSDYGVLEIFDEHLP